MSVSRLSYRYAKSLLDLSQEQKVLDKVYNDMVDINETIAGSPDFNAMLKSPIINGDKKTKIVDAVFGDKVSDLTIQFLHLLIKKGREKDLAGIGQALVEMYNAMNNVKEVTIKTASTLGKATLDEIRKKVEEANKGEKITFKTEVDASLIGGFVLQYDDKLLDSSIKRKLGVVRKLLVDS